MQEPHAPELTPTLALGRESSNEHQVNGGQGIGSRSRAKDPRVRV
jgi:hypothetical protein